MKQIFKNRQEAGLILSAQIALLPKTDLKNAIVLALPRGGVPVAREISKKLEIPFDVLIVRKIGHPFHPEYGIGAVTENNISWMDPEAVGLSKIKPEQIEALLDKEKRELERRLKIFRSERSLPDLKNKTVILVDDGLATGVTARVAGLYAKSKGARKVILAIPICSGHTAQRLKDEIDHVLCLNTPKFFQSVSEFYQNFEQLTDDEVIELLPQSSLIYNLERSQHV